jgi:t-SNARE complex subunit (syntaxin)
MEMVSSGVGHLQAAKQTQKKTRKWMCCAIGLGVVILVAVVIAAVGIKRGF